MRDAAASDLGRISAKDGGDAILAARPHVTVQPEGTALAIAGHTGTAQRPGGRSLASAAGAAAERSAADALSALCSAHYRSLVRMAVLLVGDLATAEEIVQDSFVAMHANWCRLKDSGKALAYTRRCVVNRSRSVLRRRMAAGQRALPPQLAMPSAQNGAPAELERLTVAVALHRLPRRQREVLVLRCYAELPEAEVASAMGISRRAVKGHVARAMSALRQVLEREA